MTKNNLIKLLEKHRYQHPDKIAVIDQDQQLSYSELFERVDKIAAYLQVNNLQNQQIGFLLENSWELLCCYIACFKAGCIAVPIRSALKQPQIEYILSSAKIKHLIIKNKKLKLSKIKQININKILQQNLSFEAQNLTFDTYAAIFYTSGTTGKPKGVLHNHQGLSYLIPIASRLAKMAYDSISLISYNINQISGISQQALPMLLKGGTVILLEPFNIEQVIINLKKYKITNLHLMPYMLGKLLNHPDITPLLFKNLRCFVSGADKVPLELHKKFHHMTRKYITEVYGATETFVCAGNSPHSIAKCGSLKPLDKKIKMKVINTHGKQAKINEIGELWVKSPGLMVGYWQNAKATKQKVKHSWFITGDMAKKDQDGLFWIMGRKKQIIIRRGANISPLQVEAAFYKHPAIKEVAVVGVPYPNEGEIPRAFVTLNQKPSIKTSEKALKIFVKQFLADYEVPDKIIFLDQMPLTPAGKIDRKKLKELL